MDYNKQAEDFLNSTRTILYIVKSVPQKSPHWAGKGEKHGTHYWVTIARAHEGDCPLLIENRDRSKEVYAFDFWDSIRNKEKTLQRLPSSYSILACLDTYADGMSFEDFCDSYGYDVDSRKAENIYNLVQEQVIGLKSVFSDTELELLNDIQ